MQQTPIAIAIVLAFQLAVNANEFLLRQSPSTQSKQNIPITPTPAPTPKPQATLPPVVKQETFFATILRVLGISALPNNTKSDEEGFDGDICLTELPLGQFKCITQNGAYRSPVFTPERSKKILAVKAGKVVLLSMMGQEEKAVSSVKAIKLVGINQSATSQVLVIYSDPSNQEAAGLLSWETGQLTPIPLNPDSDDDRKMLSHLRGWDRYYGSSNEISVNSEIRVDKQFGIRWREVQYRDSKGKIEVTQCKPNRCGQPSLSESHKSVVFIKAK